MGTRYCGDYYITGTCHRYIRRVYKTDFTVRGLREGSLLSTLPPKTHLQPGQTHLVGLVTNNNDPKGWGRVKVKFPTLNINDESHWARVVGLGAGKERGFYCLPEIDDEVLVAFEHGDIHRPY
ncbi:MAG: phage baseplate assembly protein V, partial [Nostoc sp.]